MKTTNAAKLEMNGQERLPGFDLLCEVAEKAFAAAVKAALEIKVSAKAIVAKVSGVVLRLAGEAREYFDADVLRSELSGLPSHDQLALLEGYGFVALAGR